MAETKRNLLFNDVFLEQRGRLYTYLKRRLVNEADAQELAQEAFLRLLRVHRGDLIVDPPAYLYRVARNLVYEQAARKLPEGSLAQEGELENIEDSHDGPDIVAERRALAERIARAIGELAPRQQAILLLFCQHDLSQREIAERLGLSKSMVQKCLAQGIAHCRKRLRASGLGGIRVKGARS